MKKLLMTGIFLMGMTGLAQADSITPQDFVNNLAEVPVKLQSHISMEIENAKEFQKQKWAESKIQFANLKKLFIKN